MPVAGSALRFAIAHRKEFLPRTPLVFRAIDPRELENVRLSVDATGITGHFEFERTIELILQLQPDAPEILCVSGTASFDRHWAEETRETFERRYHRFACDGSRASQLPRLWTSKPFAPHGGSALNRDVARRAGSIHVISRCRARSGTRFESANLIYGVSSNFLNAGVVGGAVIDFGAMRAIGLQGAARPMGAIGRSRDREPQSACNKLAGTTESGTTRMAGSKGCASVVSTTWIVGVTPGSAWSLGHSEGMP